MAFDKKRNTPPVADSEYDENETAINDTPQGFVDVDDEVQQTEEEDPTKPLLDEVTFVGTGNSKNVGGAKQWICVYCKCNYTSSYTRIHVHFFWGSRWEKSRD